VFAGFTSVSAVWYFVWGRRNFIGPVMHVKGPAGEMKTIDAQPVNSNITEENTSEITVMET
jgi:hypothetical protein